MLDKFIISRPKISYAISLGEVVQGASGHPALQYSEKLHGDMDMTRAESSEDSVFVNVLYNIYYKLLHVVQIVLCLALNASLYCPL